MSAVDLPAIEFKNVSMSFGKEVLLKNISFSLFPGKKLVLIGPSGHGKSVILKLIGGILKPTSGEVLINGCDLNKVDGSQRQELLKSMGMLFQKNALFDSLTCAENIAFPLNEVTDKSTDEIEKIVDYFLKEVAIPHAKNLYPSEISGGMQKRLGVARALALNPKIILYDDPTAGLDPITSRRIANLILLLQKENKSTLVTITNDMNRAYQLGNTIAMVVDGELIQAGDEESTKRSSDPRVKQFISGSISGPLTEAQHD